MRRRTAIKPLLGRRLKTLRPRLAAPRTALVPWWRAAPRVRRRTAPEIRWRTVVARRRARREILLGHGTPIRDSTARRPDSRSAEIVIAARRRIEISALTLGRAGITGVSAVGCCAGTRSAPGRSAIIALHAEHTPGAGVGIEHQYTPVGGQPFQAVMGLPIWTEIGSFDIGKGAGAFSAYSVDDVVQRADLARLHAFARTIGLGRCRFGDRGCAEQNKTYQWRKVPHEPPFTAESLNST